MKNRGRGGDYGYPFVRNKPPSFFLRSAPPWPTTPARYPFCLRLPTVNFQLGTVDFLFPCATLSAPFGGETHADTRGRLETVVRVHGFGELAQTHAGGGSVCARLCAQSRGGRRNLGAGGAAA